MCQSINRRAYLLLQHYRYSAWRLKNKTTMATTKEDSTAAAAEQLGSMSLGVSVERNDDDAEPTAAESKKWDHPDQVVAFGMRRKE